MIKLHNSINKIKKFLARNIKFIIKINKRRKITKIYYIKDQKIQNMRIISKKKYQILIKKLKNVN